MGDWKCPLLFRLGCPDTVKSNMGDKDSVVSAV